MSCGPLLLLLCSWTFTCAATAVGGATFSVTGRLTSVTGTDVQGIRVFAEKSPREVSSMHEDATTSDENGLYKFSGLIGGTEYNIHLHGDSLRGVQAGYLIDGVGKQTITWLLPVHTGRPFNKYVTGSKDETEVNFMIIGWSPAQFVGRPLPLKDLYGSVDISFVEFYDPYVPLGVTPTSRAASHRSPSTHLRLPSMIEVALFKDSDLSAPFRSVVVHVDFPFFAFLGLPLHVYRLQARPLQSPPVFAYDEGGYRFVNPPISLTMSKDVVIQDLQLCFNSGYLSSRDAFYSPDTVTAGKLAPSVGTLGGFWDFGGRSRGFIVVLACITIYIIFVRWG